MTIFYLPRSNLSVKNHLVFIRIMLKRSMKAENSILFFRTRPISIVKCLGNLRLGFLTWESFVRLTLTRYWISSYFQQTIFQIYKRGSDVRIDTTLVGFEGSSWKRGHQTFIFRLATIDDAVRPQFILLDHDAHTATIQTMRDDEPLEAFRPSSDATAFRYSYFLFLLTIRKDVAINFIFQTNNSDFHDLHRRR